MQELSKEELEIFYAALVNHSTAEMREHLQEQGHDELAAKINPLGLAFLAMKVEAMAKAGDE